MGTLGLGLSALFGSASCADLASDCTRLGTCGPGGDGGGASGGGDGLPLGAACGAPTECASGNCADGVCCDRPCDEACDAQCGGDGLCQTTPAGEACPDLPGGRCDSGGRCVTGAQDFALVYGTPSADRAATRSALLSDSRAVVAGTALNDASITVAGATADGVIGGGPRGFSARLEGMNADGEVLTWGADTEVTHVYALPDDRVLYAGTFEADFDPGGMVNDVSNTGAADAFVVLRAAASGADEGQAEWLYRVVSTTGEAAAVEALAGSAQRTAVAVIEADGASLSRAIQVLVNQSGIQGARVGITLGATLSGGRIADMVRTDDDELWVLAEYVGTGSVGQGSGTPQALQNSGMAMNTVTNQTVVFAFDDALDVTKGPVYLGEDFDVFAGGLAVTDDTVYVSGGWGSSLAAASQTFPGPDGEVALNADQAGTDPFVLALDRADPQQARWGRVWPADGDARAVDVAAVPRASDGDPGVDVVVAGNFTAGQVNFGDGPVQSNNLATGYVVKVAPNGAPIWVNSAADPNSELTLRWVGVAPDGNVWGSGSMAGDFAFGASGLGDLDAFVVRFAP